MAACKSMGCVRGITGGFCFAAFFAFLAYMMSRGMLDKSELGQRTLVIEATIYVPLWYIIVTAGGLMPTFMIGLRHRKWTAPPFNYRKRGDGIIFLHVVPATLWLGGSVLQLFFTTVGTPSWDPIGDPKGAWLLHRSFGLTWMNTIFMSFQLSAIYSLVSKLSPLGKHVQAMEWLLAIGTLGYFTLGMFYISLHIEAYHTGHKICMVMTMITASGPGFFRVLRHLRELITGRLFKPDLFTEYDDVPNNSANLVNFKNVESTYFCLAFLLTDAYTAFVFHQMGVLLQSEWSPLCLTLVVFPVLAVVGSILWRYTPNHHKDFEFRFALDYNFSVLQNQSNASTASGIALVQDA